VFSAPINSKQQRGSASSSTTHSCSSLSLANRAPLVAESPALSNIISRPLIQTKLKISSPNDRYEQEADRVAAQVMRMPEPNAVQTQTAAPQIQRLCPECEEELQRQPENEEEEEELIQPKSNTAMAPQVTLGIARDIHSLKGTGQPLPVAERAFFEPRFGRDFSNVRVHADNRAARTARAINARAFTLGHDVVFGAGEFRPQTGVGRRLMAHELTHTIQQANVGASLLQREATPPRAIAPARAYREYVEEVITMMTEAAVFSYAGGLDNARIQRLLENWFQTTQRALAYIRQYLGNDRALTQRVGRTYIGAIESLIRGASSQLGLRPHELFTRHRSRIHAWGWPERLSEELPAGQRRRLRVVTHDVQLDASRIEQYFSTVGGRTTLGFTPRISAVRIADAIPANLHHGLRNTAAALLEQGLVPNSTITIDLDLRPHGGTHAAYRFTYVQLPGRRRGGRVLVERLGAVPTRRAQSAQRRVGEQRFQRHGFVRDANWADSEYAVLLEAIAYVSDTQLSRIQGVTFQRAARPAPPGRRRHAHGDYDVATHIITIYDSAFRNIGLTRSGGPGQPLANSPAMTILHEIGHAIDLIPLGSAHRDLEAVESAQARGPRLASARRAFQTARSASGSRWQWSRRHREYRLAEGGRGAASNAFRQALRADGGVRVTTLPDRVWREYFAEAFVIYVTDPDTLHRLRPNVYQYFVTNFPNQ